MIGMLSRSVFVIWGFAGLPSVFVNQELQRLEQGRLAIMPAALDFGVGAGRACSVAGRHLTHSPHVCTHLEVSHRAPVCAPSLKSHTEPLCVHPP